MQSLGLHLLLLNIFCNAITLQLQEQQKHIFCLLCLTLKLTVPSTKAKRVWSLPIPMFSPGWNSVPL